MAAFTENVNGGKPILAGCNMLGLSFKEEEFDYNTIKVNFLFKRKKKFRRKEKKRRF